MEVDRFRSFSFLFMGDGCGFHPLIFPGVDPFVEEMGGDFQSLSPSGTTNLEKKSAKAQVQTPLVAVAAVLRFPAFPVIFDMRDQLPREPRMKSSVVATRLFTPHAALRLQYLSKTHFEVRDFLQKWNFQRHQIPCLTRKSDTPTATKSGDLFLSYLFFSDLSGHFSTKRPLINIRTYNTQNAWHEKE